MISKTNTKNTPLLLNRPTPAIKFLTTSTTKVNARKCLTEILFINTSPILENHQGNLYDELQTTEEQINRAEYLTICLIAHTVKTLTLFKSLKF